MRDIDSIIIHCADTPDGREFHAADIDRWHRERGWRCIGYHYVIALDGTVEPGRPVEEIGAHVKGHNLHSIGICLIGRTRFTRAQWNALDRLVSDLGLRFPDATLHGHNEFNSAKTCPGFDVAQWITEPLRVEMAHLWEEA